MIPSSWEPYHRDDDGELVGYLSAEPAGLVPRTLLGTPLDEPLERFDAEQVLEEVGLSYLADPWVLTLDDGSQRRVVLVEVDAERAVVAGAAFAQVVGAPRDAGDQVELPLPTDRLRRA